MKLTQIATVMTLLGVLDATFGADPDVRVQPLEIFVEAGTPHVASAVRVPKASHAHLLRQVREHGRIRVIVGLDVVSLPKGSQAEQIATSQATFLERVGPSVQVNRRFRTIPFVALSLDADGLQRIYAMRDVRSVEADVALRPLLATSNPVIGTPSAWAQGLEGTGQVIAVLDSGIAAEHQFFSATGNKLVSEACYSTTDPAESATSLCPGGAAESTASGSGADCPADVYPCFHGTHVGGIAVGHDGVGPNYGVARGADLVGIQVFSRIDDAAECDPRPSPCLRSFTSDLLRALERVLELGATFDIAAVNLSLGGGGYTSVEECDAENPATLAITAALRAAGIAVVAASGNSGTRDRLVAPACLSAVVSVASTNDTDGISSFSSVASFLDLLAPGHRIDSAVPGGGVGRYSGTSMAAPHVAGAWALIREVHPGASVERVLHTLKSTAVPVDDLRQNGVLTGVPRIDVALAITAPVESWFFTLFNDGDATLDVTSIAPETAAPWIRIAPSNLMVEPGGHAFVTLEIDLAEAPADGSRTRLLIVSNDPDESPLPDGVYVETSPLPSCGNADGDAFNSCDDCDDTDPHRWGTEEWNDGFDNQCPGQVGFGQVDETGTNAVFHASGDLLLFSWAPQPGADEYEVARALDPGFGTACVVIRLTETEWHDTAQPGAGSAFFYLGRASSPWPGSWGLGVGGAERRLECP